MKNKKNNVSLWRLNQLMRNNLNKHPVIPLNINQPYIYMKAKLTIRNITARAAMTLFALLCFIVGARAQESMVFKGLEDNSWSKPANWTIDGKVADRLPGADDEVTIEAPCVLDNETEVASVVVKKGKTLTIGDHGLLTTNKFTLNDGAQLFTPKNNGKKRQVLRSPTYTIEKEIQGYGEEETGGWYLLPCLVQNYEEIGNLLPNVGEGDYDFYSFHGDYEQEWINYKSDPDAFPAQFGGYLYANREDVTLSIVSESFSTEDEVSYALGYNEEAYLPGYHLLGNPFPCNAQVICDNVTLYGLNEDGSALQVFNLGDVIAPGEGLFAVASEDGVVVTFSRVPDDANVGRMDSNDDNATQKDDAMGSRHINKLARDGGPQLLLPQHGEFENQIAHVNNDPSGDDPSGDDPPEEPKVFDFMNTFEDCNWSNIDNWTVDGELATRLPGAEDEVNIKAPCVLDCGAEVAYVTVSDGATLTLGEYQLFTTDLTLEDGAQLYAPGYEYDLNVTIRKEIIGYDGDGGGWNLLSVPEMSVYGEGGSFDYGSAGMIDGDYDLYLFDQNYLGPLDQSEGNGEWRNYKYYMDNGEAFKADYNGYLYANSQSKTLSFWGHVCTQESFTYSRLKLITSDDHAKGFNLVGNPYPCNAKVQVSSRIAGLYMLNDEGNALIKLDLSEYDDDIPLVVPPCTALFAVATANNHPAAYVTFTPTLEDASPIYGVEGEEVICPYLPNYNLAGNQDADEEPEIVIENDARLQSITPSVGMLVPEFSPDETIYDLEVNYTGSPVEVTLTAVPIDPEATVEYKYANDDQYFDTCPTLRDGDEIEICVNPGNYEKIYTVTVNAVYSITMSFDGEGTAKAYHKYGNQEESYTGYNGDYFILKATPAEGYKFKEWQLVSGNGTLSYATSQNGGEYRIGTNNSEIKAVFEVIPLTEIDLANNADNTDILNRASTDGDCTVTLTGRTIYTDGDWNTLCLPFSLESLTGTPLDGFTVKELDTTNEYEGRLTGYEDGTLYLNFTDATSIVAGKPYIVKKTDMTETTATPTYIPDEGTGGTDPRQGYANLVDGSTEGYRWRTNMTGENPSSYCMFHTNQFVNVTGYTLTTGNQNVSGDPTVWTLKAKRNKGDAWMVIDSRNVNENSGDALPSGRTKDKSYTVEVPGVYQYFLFEVTQTGGNFMCLTELTLQCSVVEFNNVENPTFTNVTINKAAPTPVTSSDEAVSFLGSYNPVGFTANDRTKLFLGASNILYYPDEAMTLGSCRAYFMLNNGLVCGEPSQGANGINAFVLNFGEDVGLGIGEISNLKPQTSNPDGWFSLDGRKLSGKPTQKGIYINNGKKVVIK